MITDMVVSTIAKIGLSSLSSCLGFDRINRLHELNIKVTAHNIAHAAFQEQGFDLFKNQKIRKHVLDVLPSERLSQIYGVSTSQLDTQKFARFQWTKNSATEKFLSIFNVELDEAFSTDDQELSFETIAKVDRSLFDYQDEIRKKLNTFLKDNNLRRVIVHMPTGSGKTRTTIEMISDFVRSRETDEVRLVVWMAHSDELCEQAVQAFVDTWSRIGTEEANVYRLWGGRKIRKVDLTKPTFLVTSFQTCHSAIVSDSNERFEIMSSLRHECDLLVVDEAHMSTAPTFQRAINFLCNQSTKLVGLSATPGRHHIGSDEDATIELAKFYENNKITLKGEEVTDNPIEYLQNRKILSRVNRVKLNTGVDIEFSKNAIATVSNYLDIPREVLTKLGQNVQRTLNVATRVIDLASIQNKQTIVFCPSKENAIDLAVLLHEKGCLARAITSDTPIFARRHWLEEFKLKKVKVLTNFGVLTTGFDAPQIEGVIIARPTTSVVLYSQMVGRGLRGTAVGGTENCTLVDVIDNFRNMPPIPQAFTFFDEHFGEL